MPFFCCYGRSTSLSFCELLKDSNRFFTHFIRVVNIGLKGCGYIAMPQSCLNILHIRPTFNQHGCVGVSQGMIIKAYLQFMVDYPGSILEGICGSILSVFCNANQPGSGEVIANTLLNGDDSIHIVPLFVQFLLQNMDGVKFAVFEFIFLLGKLFSFQGFIQGLPKGNGSV